MVTYIETTNDKREYGPTNQPTNLEIVDIFKNNNNNNNNNGTLTLWIYSTVQFWQLVA